MLSRALLVGALEACEAEVANFDVVFGVEQHVLGLEVPVHQLLPVQVHHGVADLLADVHALGERKAATALVKNVKNILALGQLLHEVAVAALGAKAKQAHYVGMLQLAHDVGLAAELLQQALQGWAQEAQKETPQTLLMLTSTHAHTSTRTHLHALAAKV